MTVAKKLPVSYRQHTGDRALDQVQRLAQQTASAVNKLGATSNPIGGGALVQSVVISNAGTNVPHTLGRVPTGYIVTRARGVTGLVFGVFMQDNGSPDATNWPLIITGATTITLDLYFF